MDNDDNDTFVCQDIFSVYSLNDSSLVNENFITDQCMSNTTKLVVYVISMIIWLIVAISIIYLFISQQYKGRKLESQVKVYLLLLVVAAAGELASYTLMLASTQNISRYVIYAVSQQCIRIVINRLSFNKCVTTLNTINVDDDRRLTAKFSTCVTIMDTMTALTTIVCCVIGPMVSYNYDNYIAVNWFYAIRMSMNNIVAVGFSCINIYSCKCLMDYCNNSHQSIDIINKVKRGLKFNITIASILLIKRVIFSFFFIRMQTNLQNIFWYHFAFYQLGLLIATTYSLHSLYKSTSSTNIVMSPQVDYIPLTHISSSIKDLSSPSSSLS